jgi:hypothetical protein
VLAGLLGRSAQRGLVLDGLGGGEVASASRPQLRSTCAITARSAIGSPLVNSAL